MKFDTHLAAFVVKDLKKGKVPCLLGEPGIGKSSWVEWLAETFFKTKCFTLAVNQLADKADLTGARLVPCEGDSQRFKQVFFPHEVIMDAVAYAEEHPRENPILFLDEINRTTADVTSAALSIPTMRRIGSIHLPANLRVIIAGNDKGNVTALDEASVSRFVLYRVEPDTATFIEIELATLNPYVKAVLEQNPEFIFCKKLDTAISGQAKKDSEEGNDDDVGLILEDILSDSEGMSQISTPRTIKAASDWLNEFEPAEIMSTMTTPSIVDGIETTLFMEGLAGHCGMTTFTVCLGEEIRKNINTLSVNSAAKGPQKPQCYDELRSQPNVPALEDFIAKLNDAEKSAAIVYAICEKADNSLLVEKLCNSTTTLKPEDARVLISQIGIEEYDTENLKVVTASNTAVGTFVNTFMSG
jgi:hypothetical protein